MVGEVIRRYQPLNALLADIAAQSVVPADRYFYTDGNDSITLGTITDDARTILANAEVGTWTPTFNFATNGDLSVSYSTQSGSYVDLGDVIWVRCLLAVTPTYTTASGTFRILGLPATPAATAYLSPVAQNSGFAYPAGKTTLAAEAETFGGVRLFATGSSSVSAALGIAEMPSGNTMSIGFSGIYSV